MMPTPNGKLGKHIGCAQGCEEVYGTYACWECPDPNGPSHSTIEAYEKTLKAIFGVSHRNLKIYWCPICDKIHRKSSKPGKEHFAEYVKRKFEAKNPNKTITAKSNTQ